MNLNYNNNEPAANNNPSNSQNPLLTNTKSINSWVQIDHHGFGDPIGGYHKVIRQDTASPVQRTVNRVTGTSAGIPNAIPNINQLFAANVVTPAGTDTQLFSVTGGQALGQFSQLTGNFASDEGYMWCSGILIQWGNFTGSIVNTPSSSITFTSRPNCINFPTGLFVVIATPVYNVGGVPLNGRTATITINSDPVFTNTTQFTWRGRTSSTDAADNYTGFRWVAIGN